MRRVWYDGRRVGESGCDWGCGGIRYVRNLAASKGEDIAMGNANRDEAGRFLAGHNLGGRPASSPDEFIREARNAVTPEQFAEAITKLYERFMRTGNVRAFAELRDTLAGKPVAQEVSGDKRFDAFVRLVEERLDLPEVDDWSGLPVDVVEQERERRASGRLEAEHRERTDDRRVG